MISYLRQLKFETISSKYIAYATGEAILIVVGILIALGVGSWVEEREFKQYERIMLNEISTSLKSRREVIDTAYLSRLEMKEEAIAELMRISSTKESIGDADLLNQLSIASIDFLFTYDAGAYEALKSSGIDRISNPQLRSDLVGFYDSFLPTWKEFIDSINDSYTPRIIEIRFELMTAEFVQEEDGSYGPSNKLIVENVFEHPAFAEMLLLQLEKAQNQRHRLDVIIPRYDELIAEIDKELVE